MEPGAHGPGNRYPTRPQALKGRHRLAWQSDVYLAPSGLDCTGGLETWGVASGLIIRAFQARCVASRFFLTVSEETNRRRAGVSPASQVGVPPTTTRLPWPSVWPVRAL